MILYAFQTLLVSVRVEDLFGLFEYLRGRKYVMSTLWALIYTMGLTVE